MASDDDDDFALHLDNTDGPVLTAAHRGARTMRRADLLDDIDHRRPEAPDASSRTAPPGGCRARSGAAKVVAAFRAYLDTIPESKRFDRDAVLRAARRRREVRLRHRQRRPAGVQRAGRGLQPGARQRRGALDEAGQRPGREPVRRHRRGRRLLRARGPPHRGQPAGAAGAHRPAARPHRASTASATSSPRSRPTRSTWTGASINEPDDMRRRGRPARPRDREDPLRLRRGQRAGPRRLPGRGRRSPRRWRAAATSSSTWLSRLRDRVRRPRARGPRAVRRRLPRGPGRDRST